MWVEQSEAESSRRLGQRHNGDQLVKVLLF